MEQNIEKHSIETVLFVFIICGAEGETRTPTRKPGLDPEPSASTSSATSAHTRIIGNPIDFQGLLSISFFIMHVKIIVVRIYGLL